MKKIAFVVYLLYSTSSVSRCTFSPLFSLGRVLFLILPFPPGKIHEKLQCAQCVLQKSAQSPQGAIPFVSLNLTRAHSYFLSRHRVDSLYYIYLAIYIYIVSTQQIYSRKRYFLFFGNISAKRIIKTVYSLIRVIEDKCFNQTTFVPFKICWH